MISSTRMTQTIKATASEHEDVIRGIASALGSGQGQDLPDTIQLFPPGKHEINATKAGKPSAMSFVITAAIAEVIRKDFLDIAARAETGGGPKPYLDFNHDDQGASAWVQDVFWAGDDPKTGGIRAKIEWTKPGAEAVVGKSYRQFSPNFRVSKTTGEIVGTTVNMGGLVNRPAFREIEPLFAKEGADSSTQEPTTKRTMNKLYEALVTAGLLSAIPTDETAALTDFGAKWSGVKAKLAELPEKDAKILTLTNTVTAKEADLKAATDKAAKFAEANADTIVAKAIEDGVIKPKDEESKKRWKTLLIADPSNASLLQDIVVSAKATAGTPPDVTKPIITKPNGTTGQTGQTTEHAFLVAAKAVQARDPKMPVDETFRIAAHENPEAYNAYRQNIMFVEGK